MWGMRTLYYLCNFSVNLELLQKINFRCVWGAQSVTCQLFISAQVTISWFVRSSPMSALSVQGRLVILSLGLSFSAPPLSTHALSLKNKH